MLAARRIPLDLKLKYEVVFVPELTSDLYAEASMDELIVEVETPLSLRFEHIAGRRIEKIEGSQDPTLYKYRPHADNDVRFVFATEDEPKRRVVLDYWPRKRDYRKQDLKTAAERFRRVPGITRCMIGGSWARMEFPSKNVRKKRRKNRDFRDT